MDSRLLWDIHAENLHQKRNGRDKKPLSQMADAKFCRDVEPRNRSLVSRNGQTNAPANTLGDRSPKIRAKTQNKSSETHCGDEK